MHRVKIDRVERDNLKETIEWRYFMKIHIEPVLLSRLWLPVKRQFRKE